MSTDKLAETLRSGVPGAGQDEESIEPAWAAARVRERFVVIDRKDLPRVAHFPGADKYICGTTTLSLPRPNVDDVQQKAIDLLALAEYLRTHPPVDEKAVKEMGRSLDRAFTETGSFSRRVRDAAASALIADGWTKP